MRVKQLFQSINQAVTFFLGLLFIFGIGVLYAYIQPEDIVLNGIFFVIALGWVVFTIKYVWDALDKKENPVVESPETQEIKELIKEAEEKLSKENTKVQ